MLRSAPVLRIASNVAPENSLFAPAPAFAPSFVSLKTLNERERDKREALNPLPFILRTNFVQ